MISQTTKFQKQQTGVQGQDHIGIKLFDIIALKGLLSYYIHKYRTLLQNKYIKALSRRHHDCC
jgi:hypothetical protein